MLRTPCWLLLLVVAVSNAIGFVNWSRDASGPYLDLVYSEGKPCFFQLTAALGGERHVGGPVEISLFLGPQSVQVAGTYLDPKGPASDVPVYNGDISGVLGVATHCSENEIGASRGCFAKLEVTLSVERTDAPEQFEEFSGELRFFKVPSLLNTSSEVWVNGVQPRTYCERAWLLAVSGVARLIAEASCAAYTDKIVVHGYHLIYARHWGSFFPEGSVRPTHRLKLLEIGLFNGGSVLMWKHLLGDFVDFHAIEISPGSVNLARSLLPEGNYYIGDQSNKTFLETVASRSGGMFDLIIDDGGHTMKQQQTSFEVLFDALAPGGLYHIEDIHTSYGHEWGGTPSGTGGTTLDSLHSLTHAMQCFYSGRPCRPDIEFVEVARSIATIRRAPTFKLGRMPAPTPAKL
mmetsp:Transcript_7540/g.17240  ORF Transcript_7540/g.17240 Transcript_7540/m.17240 type:complete len:404 (+) Transcript_7540:1-1212(+)